MSTNGKPANSLSRWAGGRWIAIRGFVERQLTSDQLKFLPFVRPPIASLLL
jgi:hypothetical protein